MSHRIQSIMNAVKNTARRKPHTRHFSAEISAREKIAQKRVPQPPKTAAAPPKSMGLTLSSPHRSFYQAAPVSDVEVTTATGMMTLVPGHIPTMQELIPGVVHVRSEEGRKTFVNGAGFVVMHSDSTVDVLCGEVFPVEEVSVARLKACAEAAEAAAAKEGEGSKRAKIEKEVYAILKAAINLKD